MTVWWRRREVGGEEDGEEQGKEVGEAIASSRRLLALGSPSSRLHVNEIVAVSPLSLPSPSSHS